MNSKLLAKKTIFLKMTCIFVTVTSFGIFSRSALAGNFSATCQIVKLSGSTMVANCADTRGNPKRAYIDLNGFVSNHNGDLVFSPHEGNFASTCRNIKITRGGILRATCLTVNQQPKGTSLNLNERIDNSNGVLTFQ